MRISFREAVRLAGVEPSVIHQLILEKRLSRGPDRYITIDIYELKACFLDIQIDEFVASVKDDPFENADREWKEHRRQFIENRNACDARVLELDELLQKYADSLAKRGIRSRIVDWPGAQEFAGRVDAHSTVVTIVTFPRVFDSELILPIGFESRDSRFHLVSDDSLRGTMQTIASELGYELGSSAQECVDLIAKFRALLEPRLAAAKEATAQRQRAAAAEAAAKEAAQKSSAQIERDIHGASLRSGFAAAGLCLIAYLAVLFFFNVLPERELSGPLRTIRALVIMSVLVSPALFVWAFVWARRITSENAWRALREGRPHVTRVGPLGDSRRLYMLMFGVGSTPIAVVATERLHHFLQVDCNNSGSCFITYTHSIVDIIIFIVNILLFIVVTVGGYLFTTIGIVAIGCAVGRAVARRIGEKSV
jgi:hypothetical protein